jgi:cytochrome c-type biogenesis protein CcmF
VHTSRNAAPITRWLPRFWGIGATSKVLREGTPMMTLLASFAGIAHGALPGRPPEPYEVLENAFGTMRSLPEFGRYGLFAVIFGAGVSFALALAAAKRPRLLRAARSAAYATCALIVFDLLLLAYAFVTHDFRIRYVARYSDRGMSTGYLLTALWGGQDGSLLWWLFLSSLNIAVCLAWMRDRYRQLQPYVIATLMSIVAFFAVTMTFAANPFEESIVSGRVDGEGLNVLLRNFYMIIHPPSLYVGFVGCAVPFAFAVAALATGRLDEEWLVAVRRWVLFAWVFLSIGNCLGMLWAYEELGWGGYWAWDPVENAAFMPWLTASAFVHSIMIQERRRMLKVWNVVLIAQTFFMTIFGTFLTRSGMIKSVHAFAQSNIGVYFAYFMVIVVLVVTGLVVFRLPLLKNQGHRPKETRDYEAEMEPGVQRALAVAFVSLIASRFIWQGMLPVMLIGAVGGIGMIGYGVYAMRKHFGEVPGGRVDSLVSREAAFVANNWVLVAMQLFVVVATIFPLISQAVTFYNRWMVPLGLILFALMGIGPVLGWRKTSDVSLRRAFRIPLMAMAISVVVHIAIGKRLGFPAFVESDAIYPGILGKILQKVGGIAPLLCSTLVVFNLTVVTQEYQRGIVARMRSKKERFFTALVELVARNRKRYGGYIVHVGIALMFFGFLGAAYKTEREYAMHVGDTVEFGGYNFTYVRERREVDPEKMMIYTDISVKKNGRAIATMQPAHFIYTRQGQNTSEVSILPGAIEDIYIAPGNVNPQTKVATLHFHVNPLTSWIWLGVVVLIFGAAVATWPEATLGEVGVVAYMRTAGATAASLVFGLLLAITPARAYAAQSTPGGSSDMAGYVEMKSEAERSLYPQLLCQCGCPRLPLSGCTCEWAEGMRAKIARRLEAGETADSIKDDYVRQFGTAALNVPPSRGFLRSIWLVPTVLIVSGGVGAVVLVRRWNRTSRKATAAAAKQANKSEVSDDYDAKLDEELRHQNDER